MTQTELQERLQTLIAQPIRRLDKLFGEASYRQYFRAHTEANRSYVVMQLPVGRESVSEEISNRDTTIAELPFLNIARYLKERGLSVPEVYFTDLAQGLLVLEDLGDRTFEKLIQDCSEPLRIFFYRQAIDLLLRWQEATAKNPAPACLAFERRFDATLLSWEFEHFLEYGIEDRLEIKIPEVERKALADFGQQLAETIAGLPQQLCHRDFQSRNLMFHRYELYLIDFQDALMGPYVYDLVALLRDSYIALAPEALRELLRYFFEAGTEKSLITASREEFTRHFHLMTLQRKLKDAGRFQYIHRVKGNSKFLVHVPDSLGYVRDAFRELPEFADIQARLAKFLPELA